MRSESADLGRGAWAAMARRIGGRLALQGPDEPGRDGPGRGRAGSRRCGRAGGHPRRPRSTRGSPGSPGLGQLLATGGARGGTRRARRRRPPRSGGTGSGLGRPCSGSRAASGMLRSARGGRRSGVGSIGAVGEESGSGPEPGRREAFVGDVVEPAPGDRHRRGPCGSSRASRRRASRTRRVRVKTTRSASQR